MEIYPYIYSDYLVYEVLFNEKWVFPPRRAYLPARTCTCISLIKTTGIISHTHKKDEMR